MDMPSRGGVMGSSKDGVGDGNVKSKATSAARL